MRRRRILLCTPIMVVALILILGLVYVRRRRERREGFTAFAEGTLFRDSQQGFWILTARGLFSMSQADANAALIREDESPIDLATESMDLPPYVSLDDVLRDTRKLEQWIEENKLTHVTGQSGRIAIDAEAARRLRMYGEETPAKFEEETEKEREEDEKEANAPLTPSEVTLVF